MQTQHRFFSLCGLILAAYFTNPSLASAQCRDPWVSQAIKQVYARNPVGQGEICECNIKLYNNGSWATYNDLVGYVQQVRTSGLQLGYAIIGNGNAVMVAMQNGQMAVSTINQSGQVITSGGANVVASGGANVVASGGANVITSGGANFSGLSRNTPGFLFGSSRQILSTGQSRLSTSGGGSLVITH